MSYSNFIESILVCPENHYLTNTLTFSSEPVVANPKVVAEKIITAFTPWPYKSIVRGLEARNKIKQIQRKQFPNNSSVFTRLDRLFNKSLKIFYLEGSTKVTKIQFPPLIENCFPRIQKVRELGRGSEGDVSSICYLTRGKLVGKVLKTLNKDCRVRNQKPDVLNAHRMKGEWLTFLKGVGCAGRYAFAYHRTIDEVCIVTEVAARNLFKYRSQLGNNEFEMSALVMEYYPRVCDLMAQIFEGRVYGEKYRRLAFCICEAVASLHSKGIMHRDLKPENILVFPDGRVKIIDFGYAVIVNEEEEKKKSCGTPLYLPPKIARARYISDECPTYSIKRDCYSVAVILYILAAGVLPIYRRESDKGAAARMFIHREGVAFSKDFSKNIKNPELLDLIQKLGAFEEKERISMTQALSHPYFRGVHK